MLYMRNSNILYREYDTFGYITDNRNFCYKTISNSEKDVGDKILSKSGSVFYSVLEKKPIEIGRLAEKIVKQYDNIDIETIVNDAKEFYRNLERDGFVVSGRTSQECEDKATRFSYNSATKQRAEAKLARNSTCSAKSTQDFLEEYFNGKPQLTSLHIEITSKCNERCLHCYIPHENKVNDIDPDLFCDILLQCKKMNVLHLTLSGGEPMLHKQFCHFLNKCKELDFSVNVLTNLTLLDESAIREMKANPLLGVQVSLYSMDHSVHDEITQVRGSFEKTTKAILELIKNNIPLQISCPIMKQNKKCYKNVIEWARENGIHVSDDYVIIARYNHTTQNLNSRLSLNEVREMIADKVANTTGYLAQMEMEAEKRRSSLSSDFICSVCNSSICIAENGNVYPCAGWQDYVVGNVKETSLNDIWNYSESVQYLRNLRKNDFPQCVHCADKEFCTMCMVRNANESSQGDPLAVNKYFCDIAKFHKIAARESVKS